VSPVTYEVQVSPCLVWKRHVNQLLPYKGDTDHADENIVLPVEEEFSNVIIPDDTTVVNVENVVEDLTGEIPIVDDMQNDIQQPERRYPLRQRTPKVILNL
jgi:hypothetical protein